MSPSDHPVSHLGAQYNMVREEKRAEGQGVGADRCEQDTWDLRVKGKEMYDVETS